MAKSFLGQVVALPAGEGLAVAKVIYQSRRFKNVVLIKLYDGLYPEPTDAPTDVGSLGFRLFYAGADPLKHGRWRVLFCEVVSEEEHLLSLRTSAGEIWLGDEHKGRASDEDLDAMPEMLVYGYKLIEKYAANPDLIVNRFKAIQRHIAKSA